MDKPYNLKTQIRSALRKVWMWSPMRRDALNRARVARGIYKCPECLKYFPNKKSLDVDHVVKVTPYDFDPDRDPTEWGILIKNLLYMDPVNGLITMCKPCHKLKTQRERNAKPKIKKKSRSTKSKGISRNKRVHTRRKKRNVFSRD